MTLTFEQWLASRQVFPEAEVGATHGVRELCFVPFKALHVFRDGAWIVEDLLGDLWTIAGHDEFVGNDIEEAARWLWMHHSYWECGIEVVELTPATPFRNPVIERTAEYVSGQLTESAIGELAEIHDCTVTEAAQMLFAALSHNPTA